MLCKKCNFENDAAAKFCENCGAKLGAGEMLALSTSYRAPLGKRFAAALLDGLIVWGMLIPSMILLSMSAFAQVAVDESYAQVAEYGGQRAGGGFVVIFLGLLYILALVYFFIKDGLGDGQSWGRRAVGLMVVHLPDGRPCTKGQSAIRALISVLLGITLIGIVVELIMVLASDSGRRLADHAAETQVIEKSILNS